MDIPMSAARDQIREYGDPLEKTIYADDCFAGLFASYAEIWTRVILPNRDPQNPGRTFPEWRPFSESHYSALIRSWNVYSSQRRLTEMATEITGSSGDAACLYLELHREYVTFFCCAGGAIENLETAFTRLPNGSSAGFTRGRKDEWGSLDWTYDRRTQAVHKIVIPFFDLQGVPHFDAKLFASPDSHWFQNGATDPKCLSDECERIWGKFAGCMAAQWSKLHEIVNGRWPKCNSTHVPVSEQPQSSGSASISVPPSGTKLTDCGGS